MSWNYRVIEHEDEDVKFYQIHEVYYDKDGNPESMTEDASLPFGDNVEDSNNNDGNTNNNNNNSSNKRHQNDTYGSITSADQLFGAAKVEIRYAYAEEDFKKEVINRIDKKETIDPVSYTHLTLPTKA